jgi:hypothetical protein
MNNLWHWAPGQLLWDAQLALVPCGQCQGWFLDGLGGGLVLRLGGGSVPLKDPLVLPFQRNCTMGDSRYVPSEASTGGRPAHQAQRDHSGSLRGRCKREKLPNNPCFIFGQRSAKSESDLRMCAVSRHLHVIQLERRRCLADRSFFACRKLYCHSRSLLGPCCARRLLWSRTRADRVRCDRSPIRGASRICRTAVRIGSTPRARLCRLNTDARVVASDTPDCCITGAAALKAPGVRACGLAEAAIRLLPNGTTPADSGIARTRLSSLSLLPTSARSALHNCLPASSHRSGRVRHHRCFSEGPRLCVVPV